MKSENLHSITIKLPQASLYTTDFKRREFDFLEIAALQMVASAPNLKHVNIVTGIERDTEIFSPNPIARRCRQRKGLWNNKKKAELASLIFNRWRMMHLNDMKEWSNCVDLTQVRNLVLGQLSDPQVLSHLTDTVGPMSLETFDITLAGVTDEQSLIHELTRWVNGLGHLRELRLAGFPMSTSLVEKILIRRGPGLRRLTLCPSLESELINSDDIKKIETHCPRLEFLKMNIVELDKFNKLKELSQICPNIDTLRELSLRIGGIAESGITGKIDNMIHQQKRTPLTYLTIFDKDVSALSYIWLALRFSMSGY